MLIAFNVQDSENALLRSAYCLNGKTRNSVANHLSLFAPFWHVPSVPVEQPKLAQRSTVEKGMSFLVLRSAAILVHLSKVFRVTGYVLDESGHFDKSGIIRQFHRDLLLTGPVSV